MNFVKIILSKQNKLSPYRASLVGGMDYEEEKYLKKGSVTAYIRNNRIWERGTRERRS